MKRPARQARKERRDAEHAPPAFDVVAEERALRDGLRRLLEGVEVPPLLAAAAELRSFLNLWPALQQSARHPLLSASWLRLVRLALGHGWPRVIACDLGRRPLVDLGVPVQGDLPRPAELLKITQAAIGTVRGWHGGRMTWWNQQRKGIRSDALGAARSLRLLAVRLETLADLQAQMHRTTGKLRGVSIPDVAYELWIDMCSMASELAQLIKRLRALCRAQLGLLEAGVPVDERWASRVSRLLQEVEQRVPEPKVLQNDQGRWNATHELLHVSGEQPDRVRALAERARTLADAVDPKLHAGGTVPDTSRMRSTSWFVFVINRSRVTERGKVTTGLLARLADRGELGPVHRSGARGIRYLMPESVCQSPRFARHADAIRRAMREAVTVPRGTVKPRAKSGKGVARPNERASKAKRVKKTGTKTRARLPGA